MSTRFGLSGGALVLLAALALNPSPSQYQRYVYRKLCQRTELQRLEAQLTCEALRLMPAGTRERILGKYVTRHNYGVFSLYVLDMPALYDESLGVAGSFVDRRPTAAANLEVVAN